MIRPTLDEMAALSAQGNLIPVWRELPADLDTPVSIYLKLAGGADEAHRAAFLLESVEGGEQVARYSFIGVAPSRLITIRGDTLIVQNGQTETRAAARGNPLDALRDLMRDYRAVPVAGLPRFTGGLVGYLAYDIVRRFERIPA